MARTVITMEDLKSSEGKAYLDILLSSIEACVNARSNPQATIGAAEFKLSSAKDELLSVLTDELLANEYSPEVWAYVGEKLNKL